LPVTHTPPRDPAHGLEIPTSTKRRLGLEDQSWIVLTEANIFAWPGPDLRPSPGKGAESVAFGALPRELFNTMRDRVLELDKQRKVRLVPRTE
jgi:hypothetical protein